MSGVIRSGPGALRGWRCLITPLSSPMENARGFSVCCAWVSSFHSISGSGVSWACTPQLDDWQLDWPFQCPSLPTGLEVSYLCGSVGVEYAVSF